VAAGADGLIVEVHSHPEQALSDGGQSLRPDKCALLLDSLQRVAAAVGRGIDLAQTSGKKPAPAMAGVNAA
jgi:3-deoxy-7-phosphoheptulonate synthase